MDILKHLYSVTCTLEEWLLKVDLTGYLKNKLILEEDSASYRQILKAAIVATKQKKDELSSFESFDQVSQQRDLLLRVVQKLKRRNEKNVLTFGFTTASDDYGAQISQVLGLEYTYPNSSFNRLQYPIWCKLLSRIGDSVMEYLLGSTSVFILVPNNSYVQLTGVPLFDLWPMTPGKYLSIPQKCDKKKWGMKRKTDQSSEGTCKQQRHREEKWKNNHDVNQKELITVTDSNLDGKAVVGSLNKKKKKKKKKILPSFSPYDYHTNINRIPMLYAKNLREKFSSNYILNTITPTEDGALTLYSHLLEHKLAISTDKVSLKWNLPELAENSVCNQSSCCSGQNFTELENDDLENHSSFYGTDKTTDRIILDQNSERSLDHNVIPQLNVASAAFPDLSQKEKHTVLPETLHSRTTKTNLSVKHCVNNERGNGSNSIFSSQGFESSENVSSSNASLETKTCTSHSQNPVGSTKTIISNELPLQSESKHNSSSIFSSQGFQSSGSEYVSSGSVETNVMDTKTSVSNSSSINASAICDPVIDVGSQTHSKISITLDYTESGEPSFTNIKPKPLEDGQNIQFSSTPLEDGHRNLGIDVSRILIPVSDRCHRNSLKRKCDSMDAELEEETHKKPRLSNDRLEENKISDENPLDKCEDEKRQDSMEIDSSEFTGLQKCEQKVTEYSTKTIVPTEKLKHQCSKEGTGLITSESENGDVLKDCVSLHKIHVEVQFMSSLQHILEKILINHRKCPYRFLLNYYCPMEKKRKKVKIYKRGQKCFGHISVTKKKSIADHLHNYVPQRQVYLLVRRVCLYVIPDEIWGTRTIRNCFHKNLRKIVSWNKYDKLCIGQLLSGVKVGNKTWLRCVKSNSVKQHVVAKIWHWIVEEFVLVVIKTFFYVTDTTQHVNRLFYYRKKTWQWLHVKALSGLVKRKIIKMIPESLAMNMLTERKALGVATLRFFPKSRGLRPIINLSKQQYIPGRPNIPINKQLLNVHQILSLIKKTNPEVVGAARFGLDEVYQAWKEYAVKQSKPLYFVKTDISNCYDEILQHKLFSIVSDVLSDEECSQQDTIGDDYLIRRYVKIVVEGGIIKRKFIRKACQLGDFKTDFNMFVKHLSKEENFHDVVFVDQVVTQHETREQVLRQLHSHIFHNVIKIGKNYYQQSKGISQGSVISTLLCNMYYGEMERKFPVGQDELMMRIVDDALFVTPCRERAVSYCEQMISGLPEFNFCINKNKVLTNFECNVPEIEGIPMLENTDWMSWCGLLLNMKTLEASVNLSFYFSCFLKDSMTFDTANKAGATLKRKLFRSLRLKCHPLYLDSQLNSMNIVIINIYKMFLMTAFKFTQYTKHLSRRNNYNFFYSMILDLSHYFHVIYSKVLKNKVFGKNGEELSRNHIQWLCLHAYVIKLNQHRSLYKPVVTMLQNHKKTVAKKVKGLMTVKLMEEICGNALLEDFKRIL